MPGKATNAIGNELFDSTVYLQNVTFPTLAANASSDTTVTCVGVQPFDCISWNMQAPPSHLVIDNIYVSAVNTLTIRWGTDGTGVTGASNLNILLEVVRTDGGNLGAAGIPGAFV
jgi:hypothetical protein